MRHYTTGYNTSLGLHSLNSPRGVSPLHIRALGDLAHNVKGTIAAADGHEEVGEDQRDDGHQLHDNVQRGAGRVLERVANCVANDGGLVGIAAQRRATHAKEWGG